MKKFTSKIIEKKRLRKKLKRNKKKFYTYFDQNQKNNAFSKLEVIKGYGYINRKR